MKKSLCVLVLAAIAVLSCVTASYSQYTTTQITNNLHEEYFPQINDDGWVVWTEYDDSGSHISLYDGTSTTQLGNDSSYNPQINDNGWVVWTTMTDLGPHIFLYDGTSMIQLSNSPAGGGSMGGHSAEINNNGWVVWEGDGSSGSNIFLYDGTSTTQLGNDSSYNPQINDNGWVVWTEYVDSGSHISLYDGTSTTQLSSGTVYSGGPQINNSGWVIWYGVMPGVSSHVFLYDGTSTTQLSSDPYYDNDFPQINNNGWVVWHAWTQEGTILIFLYDGTSTIPLTTNNWSVVPQINDNGWVVWMCLETSSGYSDVFLYDGTSTTQLSNDHVNMPGSMKQDPQISDNGSVVWIELVNPSGEIFLSVPNTDTDGDGITNEVDTMPSTYSNDFSDESLQPPGVTSGTISDRGDQLLTITEEANPRGVKITADSSGGVAQASVSGCDSLVSLSFTPGDEAILTCGSAHVEVLIGPIEGLVGGQISITVSGGATATVTEAGQDQFEIENTGVSGTISVEYQGEIVELNTGESVSITTPGPGACSATAQASTHQVSPVYGPTSLGKHLAFLVLPIGAVIGLRIWCMKR